jgi:hypothetical protein
MKISLVMEGDAAVEQVMDGHLYPIDRFAAAFIPAGRKFQKMREGRRRPAWNE